MPKRTYLVALVRTTLVAATMAAVGASAALAQGSAALQSKAASANVLYAKATSSGGVRVIVTLSGATGAAAAQAASSAASEAAVPPAAGVGPLGDGQIATQEQTQLLVAHVGSDQAKRDRWAPRIIPNTPYVAMTVSLSELEALAADPSVVSIHEDEILRAGLQDSVPLIGMPSAYNINANGTNTMVAVLDTGVEYGHVFMSGRVTNATCFSTNNATFATLCPNGGTSQIGGNAGQNCGVAGCAHGTHVAGIAAGNRASGTPLNGVARAATIFAGQVFSRRISDNALTAFDSDILASLNDILSRVSPGGELASRNLAAINLSIWDVGFQVSGNCDSVARGIPFKSVIDSLRVQRVATVIISGNDAQRTLSAFPGCISSAVTVGATSKADLVASYSNMSTIVDLLAPGGESTTTATQITSSVPPTPSFAGMQGTSMAAPHVTGAFAAVRSACTGATPDAIENALKSTGISIADNRSGGTFTKPRIRVDLAVQSCSPNVVSCTQASQLGDFNADGRSDMLFKRTSDGLLTQYLMNGFSVQSFAALGVVGPEFRLVAAADFDGDGRADMLFRRNSDGLLTLYLMNGPQVISAQSLGIVGLEFDLVGTADVNGDGRADMLFRRRTDGMLALYLMNGFQVLAAQFIGMVGPEFRFGGLRDFNGDGRADMLFRRASDGMLALYLMNGFQVQASQFLGVVGPEFNLVGVRDFSGDGRADILFRRASDGLLSQYQFNGFQLIAAQSLGTVGNEFSLIGLGDLNGDGRADMLFRRNSDGVLTLYLMNGFQVLQSGGLGMVGPEFNPCYGQPPA